MNLEVQTRKLENISQDLSHDIRPRGSFVVWDIIINSVKWVYNTFRGGIISAYAKLTDRTTSAINKDLTKQQTTSELTNVSTRDDRFAPVQDANIEEEKIVTTHEIAISSIKKFETDTKDLVKVTHEECDKFLKELWAPIVKCLAGLCKYNEEEIDYFLVKHELRTTVEMISMFYGDKMYIKVFFRRNLEIFVCFLKNANYFISDTPYEKLSKEIKKSLIWYDVAPYFGWGCIKLSNLLCNWITYDNTITNMAVFKCVVDELDKLHKCAEEFSSSVKGIIQDSGTPEEAKTHLLKVSKVLLTESYDVIDALTSFHKWYFFHDNEMVSIYNEYLQCVYFSDEYKSIENFYKFPCFKSPWTSRYRKLIEKEAIESLLDLTDKRSSFSHLAKTKINNIYKVDNLEVDGSLGCLFLDSKAVFKRGHEIFPMPVIRSFDQPDGSSGCVFFDAKIYSIKRDINILTQYPVIYSNEVVIWCNNNAELLYKLRCNGEDAEAQVFETQKYIDELDPRLFNASF